MGFLWEWDVDWTGSGSFKMAVLTLEVSELPVYAVTNLVAPFSSCNHTFTMSAVNIPMRQVWTLIHAHRVAACVTAAQQCSVLLTLPSASGCRYATILASPHLQLTHRLQAWLAFRKVYCFTKFYIHGSVHRESNLIIYATYSVYYISVGSTTCFGCWHPSSGAGTAVITASAID